MKNYLDNYLDYFMVYAKGPGYFPMYKEVKVRIFNDFFYGPFSLRDTQSTSITPYFKYWTDFNSINFYTYKKRVSFEYNKNSFPIIGYYDTNNYTVFCGPPDPKTLIKSYKNNKEDTLKKIMSLVNTTDPYTILELAESCL